MYVTNFVVNSRVFKLHFKCYFSYAAVISDNNYLGKMAAIIANYIFSGNIILTKSVSNYQKLPAGPRI